MNIITREFAQEEQCSKIILATSLYTVKHRMKWGGVSELFPFLDSFSVLTGLRIDADNVVLIDEEGDVDRSAGFYFDLFDPALSGIASDCGRGFYYFEVHFDRQFNADYFIFEKYCFKNSVRF